MSIRAYKVQEIVHAESDSFNIYHDIELVDFLQKGGWLDSLNLDGNGLIDVPSRILQKAIDTLNLDPDVVEVLKKDIAESHNGWVRYYCY